MNGKGYQGWRKKLFGFFTGNSTDANLNGLNSFIIKGATFVRMQT